MKRTAILIGIILLAAAGLVSCGGEPITTSSQEGCTFPTPADGAATVLIPGGTFEMGSAQGEQAANEDEFPLHSVTLSCFFIYKEEVTNRQYSQCITEGECLPVTPVEGTMSAHYAESAWADHPVVGVDYNMASAYCAWTGGRLPTEAEWEYAASASQEIFFPWGDEPPDCEKASFSGCLDPAETTAAGSLTPGESPFKVQDLAGNAWEWVLDWYDPGYYAVSPSTSPIGPLTGSLRVVRGGAYDSDLHLLRLANRQAGDPYTPYSNAGFRCAFGPILLPGEYDPGIPKYHRPPKDGGNPVEDGDPGDVLVATHPLDCPPASNKYDFVMTISGTIPFTVLDFNVEGQDTTCSMYDPVTQLIDCILQDPPDTPNPFWNAELILDSGEWQAPRTILLTFAKPQNCSEAQNTQFCDLEEVECTSPSSIGFLVNILDTQTQQGVELQPGSVSAVSGASPYTCDLIPNVDGRIYCAGPHPQPVTDGLSLDYTLLSAGSGSCTWDMNTWIAKLPGCSTPPKPQCAAQLDAASCTSVGCKWVNPGGGLGLQPYCTDP